MVRRAAQAAIEPFDVCLARPFDDVDLHQPVADEQRSQDPGLDRLLVQWADQKAIDDGVHDAHL
jgi:hypothetical protein